MHRLSDEFYRTIWPHPISDENIEAGIYLKSFTPQEELAEFIATRAYCLWSNRYHAEAEKLLACSLELMPNHAMWLRHRNLLRNWLRTCQRGPWLNQPRNLLNHTDELPPGPHRIHLGGREAFVQIVPKHPSNASWSQPFEPGVSFAGGIGMQTVHVQLPSGGTAMAQAPPLKSLFFTATLMPENRV